MTDIDSRSTGPESKASATAQTAQHEATAVAHDAKHAATEVASTAQEQVGHVAHEASRQVKNVVSDATSRLAEEAEEQAKRVARGLRGLADELSSMADNGSPDSPATGALRQVADSGRQAAGFLDERGVRGAVDSATDFARRKPGAFLLGAAVAGFLAGRVVKSASGGGGGTSAPRPPAPLPTNPASMHGTVTPPTTAGTLPPPAVPVTAPPVVAGPPSDPLAPPAPETTPFRRPEMPGGGVPHVQP
ncbi:hypothetical protein [Umezawaea beigongshangensis]|uniref:hypothetical protein n=1 Tax=Umezawaea beigongshangensis TaxID=2780383 RepID=UPI0018F1CAB6|nr:hypothetical protein [Umezawaea beigongshangensis]